MTADAHPRVLITGANSGIGAAATAAVLARGADVVATVRTERAADAVRRAHGAALRSDALTVALLDVTDAQRCRRVVDRHRPGVVVNTAGDAALGAMMDLDDDTARDQFETLVIAPVRLARFALPHLRDAGGGRIVNVSSTTATTPVPFTGWYGPAKAALDVATDSLRLEMGPSGVDVIRIECGAIDTPAWDDAGDVVRLGSDPATRVGRRRWATLTNLVRPRFPEAAEVGEVIAEAALDPRPRSVYRIGFGSRLGLVSSFLPTPVEDLVVRTVFGLHRA